MGVGADGRTRGYGNYHGHLSRVVRAELEIDNFPDAGYH